MRRALLIGWRWFRIAAVVLVFTTVGSMYCRLFFMTMSINGEKEEQLRQRLVDSGKISMLKTWAMDRLHTQQWRGSVTEGELLDLGKIFVEPVKDKEGRMIYYELYLRSGFRHQGLLVGPPGFEPIRQCWPYVNKWCDQIWYFDDALQD
jgi:hypothetical protein